MRSGYMALTANLLRNRDSWKMGTYIMLIVWIMTLTTLMVSKSNAPSYLVPYAFAESNGRYEVKPRGGTEEEYLSRIAMADISSIMIWTPRTIHDQYSRFLNRAAPELFASKNLELIEQADEYAKIGYSQTYYVENVRIAKDMSYAEFSGLYKLWQGSELIIERQMTYQLKYIKYNGLYMPMAIEDMSKGGDA